MRNVLTILFTAALLAINPQEVCSLQRFYVSENEVLMLDISSRSMVGCRADNMPENECLNLH